MYTLFRILLQQATWRGLWVAFRRSGRDAHARTVLVRFFVWIAIFLLSVGCELYWFRGILHSDPRFFAVLLIGCIFLGAFFFVVARVQDRRDHEQAESESPSVAPQVKERLYREAYVLGSLLIRASSERGMEKELPPGIEVITRRTVIDRLKSRGYWDSLASELRDLLLAPDGHWLETQKERSEQLWETFYVLAHVLGLLDLPSLSYAPRYRLAIAYKVLEIESPAKLAVLASWDIRPLRDSAERIFNRCWIELVARGVAKGVAADVVEEAAGLRESLAQLDYTDDFLVDAHRLGEIPNDLLRMVAVRTYRRIEALRLLVDILCESKMDDGFEGLIVDHLTPERKLSNEDPA